jgi:hypothetical protein
VPGTAYTGSSDGFIGRNDATTPSLMQVFDSSTGIAKNITIPAYVAFTGTAASAAVSPAALFTPSSAALQIWDIKATINEVTAGTGCSGSYTVTITWNDGSANSYTLATVPWVSSISAASGSSLGTRAFGELVIQQASTASPTYAVSVPTGCTSMQYAWSVHAARLN